MEDLGEYNRIIGILYVELTKASQHISVLTKALSEKEAEINRLKQIQYKIDDITTEHISLLEQNDI